jgi:Raf kinase inhibitor-like YbhB/YbcL family protein
VTNGRDIRFATSLIILLLVNSATGSPSQMTITSPAFSAGGEIPAKFTCNGQSTSPELRISGTPPGAKTLVLIADDPDAPGGEFTHWLVWNIDPQTTRWAENSVPTGALQGTNDFSKKGYGPPCPPSGTHRYIFKIFALDRPLELKAGARRADVEGAMRGHVLAQGELIGRYTHK